MKTSRYISSLKVLTNYWVYDFSNIERYTNL